MRNLLRTGAGVFLLTAALVPAALASRGDAAPAVQQAIVTFTEATRIADVFVLGPVLIVHDDRMYLGEPCTTVYRFEPGVGPREILTMFACKPRNAGPADKFTIRTERDPMVGCPVVTEFQFAGDAEAHGVPQVFD